LGIRSCNKAGCQSRARQNPQYHGNVPVHPKAKVGRLALFANGRRSPKKEKSARKEKAWRNSNPAM
jgi:hypothetical protein